MRTELDECGVRRTYQSGGSYFFGIVAPFAARRVYTQSWLAFQSEVIGAQGIM